FRSKATLEAAADGSSSAVAANRSGIVSSLHKRTVHQEMDELGETSRRRSVAPLQHFQSASHTLHDSGAPSELATHLSTRSPVAATPPRVAQQFQDSSRISSIVQHCSTAALIPMKPVARDELPMRAATLPASAKQGRAPAVQSLALKGLAWCIW